MNLPQLLIRLNHRGLQGFLPSVQQVSFFTRNGLQNHSRKIDTAARYGGDEFALVIPEVGIEVARQLANRISEWLAGDGEAPALSVSIGAAVCPQDGESIEMLLRAADRDLYEGKPRSGRTATSLPRAAN
jgi:diguanylate cyclase (GGDEF)-like protein